MTRVDDKSIATGIRGFDAASYGGLPRGRTTSVVGSAGAGKTVFALQTLAHRMREYGEHTIFVTFEQPVEHVLRDIEGFDWDFRALVDDHLTLIDAGIGPEAVRNGQFSLEGLLATLNALAADRAATVVVLDGIDALLSMLESEELERQEMSRVLDWLRTASLTGIVTVKAPDDRSRSRARTEYLEYHSDCVLGLGMLSVATTNSRTLTILKYRGSDFDGDVLPVVMTSSGIEVIGAEVTASPPDFELETSRLTSGLPELDELLDGGYLRSSATLLSGSPGTAKSTLATAFLTANAEAGRRGIYISFDETERQVATHMSSVGLLVRPLVESGLISIHSMQANSLAPEQHVADILRVVDASGAEVVVIDPISAVLKNEHPFAVRMTEYLVLELRQREITLVCTSLLDGLGTGTTETTLSHVSTIADNWIHVSYVPHGGERNRALTIVKSRGTAHSNQVRELVLSSDGVSLRPVYTSEGEVLLGSARLQKEAADRRVAEAGRIEQDRLAAAADLELDQLAAQLAVVQHAISRKRSEADLLKQERADLENQVDVDLRDRVDARRMPASDSAADSSGIEAVLGFPGSEAVDR
jgi:circadian clock protein KaiC